MVFLSLSLLAARRGVVFSLFKKKDLEIVGVECFVGVCKSTGKIHGLSSLGYFYFDYYISFWSVYYTNFSKARPPTHKIFCCYHIIIYYIVVFTIKRERENLVYISVVAPREPTRTHTHTYTQDFVK